MSLNLAPEQAARKQDDTLPEGEAQRRARGNFGSISKGGEGRSQLTHERNERKALHRNQREGRERGSGRDLTEQVSGWAALLFTSLPPTFPPLGKK
ncbi:hypothetical protein R1flu_017599 [Riccia fluitans]|uniref:Uncharacterized protein n=1 Tax=Riccia fluitans TaxID=41844 RepID=A0ABD1ZDF4_9MARC